MIADRTTIENAPAAEGSIFVVADSKRDIELPDVTIRTRKGPGPAAAKVRSFVDLAVERLRANALLRQDERFGANDGSGLSGQRVDRLQGRRRRGDRHAPFGQVDEVGQHHMGRRRV